MAILGQQCHIGSMAMDKSMSKVFKEIMQIDGVKGLFTGFLKLTQQSHFLGLTPRLVKVPPACAIMISTFEYLKLWFDRQNQRKL